MTMRLIPGDAVSYLGVQSRSCVEREDDECSFVHSESCWGEMEDIGDDEVPQWGVLPCPTSFAHAIPWPHGVDCDRVANHAESRRGSKKKRLLLIRSSQQETVAASSPSHNPFAALTPWEDTRNREFEGESIQQSGEVEVRPGRLVLVGGNSGVPHQPSPVSFADGDTDSVASDLDTEVETSIAGDVEVEEFDDEREVAVGLPRGVVLRMALMSLDEVDTTTLFRQRASVMRSVPKFLHGQFRNVFKQALEEATWRNYRQDEVQQERGWKLFELLPTCTEIREGDSSRRRS